MSGYCDGLILSSTLCIAYNVIAADRKKKPMRTKAIAAKARFVTIRCCTVYERRVQMLKNIPRPNEIAPGSPRQASGLSSTISLKRDIKTLAPCLTGFSEFSTSS